MEFCWCLAGEQVKRYGNKLPRITGLDAAAPLFRCVPRWHKLTKDDAVHVDAIHTDAGLAGKRESYGTADYFPNGGGPIQPGCSTGKYSLVIIAVRLYGDYAFEKVTRFRVLSYSVFKSYQNLATMW